MRFSEQLTSYIRVVKSRAWVIDLFDPDVFLHNLLFLHDLVVATEPLLKDAIEACERLSDDPLGAYMRQHLEEERGHLDWLRRDLDGVQLPRLFPHPAAMALIGTQYYMIRHIHPASLLGYMATVEGDPVTLELVERLESVHGAGRMHFIRQHATTDLEHRRELWSVIDEVPPERHDLIWRSASSSLSLFAAASAEWRH